MCQGLEAHSTFRGWKGGRIFWKSVNKGMEASGQDLENLDKKFGFYPN